MHLNQFLLYENNCGKLSWNINIIHINIMLFQNLGTFSWNIHFWCCSIFSIFCNTYPVKSFFFQWQFESTLFKFLMKHFFPSCNQCYYDCNWEYIFFLIPWQTLLRKQISSKQQCSLSIQTIPHKIGVKQIAGLGISSSH